MNVLADARWDAALVKKYETEFPSNSCVRALGF
jgi:hypothetical protein